LGIPSCGSIDSIPERKKFLFNAVLSFVARAATPAKRALRDVGASATRAAGRAVTGVKDRLGGDAAPAAAAVDPTEALLERARVALVECPAAAGSPVFPVEALGDLAPVCRVIAEEAQLEVAMAALPLLLAIAVIAQRDYWVKTLAGIKPVSMYGLTLGLSGEGKTTAENAALRAITNWEAARRTAGDKSRLRMGDTTMPSVKRRLKLTPLGMVGLFTSEGGSLIGGHAMSAENKVGTGAFLNGLWDDAMLVYARSTTDEDVSESDRYLTASIMVQPSVAAKMLMDPVLADIGLLPRFFQFAPPPSAPRKALDFDLEKHPVVAQYYGRCEELLANLDPEQPPKRNVMEFDPEALELAKEAFEFFDREAKVGSMQVIRPFAIRATELMCRAAAVLAIYAGNPKIGVAQARGARQLIDYSLGCWMRTFNEAPEIQGSKAAYELLCYIAKKQGGGPCEEILLAKSGPAATRNVEAVRAALKLLSAYGFVERRGKQATVKFP
jgi:hypothetical protein